MIKKLKIESSVALHAVSHSMAQRLQIVIKYNEGEEPVIEILYPVEQ